MTKGYKNLKFQNVKNRKQYKKTTRERSLGDRMLKNVDIEINILFRNVLTKAVLRLYS